MNFIITADWHLRDDRPRCRKDEDWMKFQVDCLRQVSDAANYYGCDVAICGDIFHRPSVSDRLKNIFLDFTNNVKGDIYAIYGQHDLHFHNINSKDRTSLGVMFNSSSILPLDYLGKSADYGDEIKGRDNGLLFLHTLVFLNEKDIPPNADAITAEEISSQHSGFEWIFAGDQHHGFQWHKDGRTVIVPGCLNRQTSDMKHYKNRIYFVNTDKGIVQEIPIEDNSELVDDSYIKQAEEKNERIEAFVEGIETSEKISLNFSGNVEISLKENSNINEEVKRWIQKLMAETEANLKDSE